MAQHDRVSFANARTETANELSRNLLTGTFKNLRDRFCGRRRKLKWFADPDTRQAVWSKRNRRFSGISVEFILDAFCNYVSACQSAQKLPELWFCIESRNKSDLICHRRANDTVLSNLSTLTPAGACTS